MYVFKVTDNTVYLCIFGPLFQPTDAHASTVLSKQDICLSAVGLKSLEGAELIIKTFEAVPANINKQSVLFIVSTVHTHYAHA